VTRKNNVVFYWKIKTFTLHCLVKFGLKSSCSQYFYPLKLFKRFFFCEKNVFMPKNSLNG